MPIKDQNCALYAPGNSYTFDIDIVRNDDGSVTDLSGAVGAWYLAPFGMSRRQAFLTKVGAAQGVSLSLQPNGLWRMSVDLTPGDTANLTHSVYYHEAVVTQANGKVSTICFGRFFVGVIMAPKTFKFGGKQYASINDFPTAILDAPIAHMKAVTPSADNDLPDGICRGVWAGANTSVSVVMADGTELASVPLVAGWNKLLLSRIKSVTGAPVFAIY